MAPPDLGARPVRPGGLSPGRLSATPAPAFSRRSGSLWPVCRVGGPVCRMGGIRHPGLAGGDAHRQLPARSGPGSGLSDRRRRKESLQIPADSRLLLPLDRVSVETVVGKRCSEPLPREPFLLSGQLPQQRRCALLGRVLAPHVAGGRSRREGCSSRSISWPGHGATWLGSDDPVTRSHLEPRSDRRADLHRVSRPSAHPALPDGSGGHLSSTSSPP